ncbi:MAG TPA: hypothetical protein VFO41_00675 [Alphaproteobacteria bacterium]|nr:hypothetical protein [Alphaproteobacteria bacterium]
MTIDLLAIAKGYPYWIPGESYLYVDGEAQPLDRLPTRGRTAVIAYGSNRSPEQLVRKFRDWPPGTEIPVARARLEGFDVVYSCHFTRYGSMPAMLHPTPDVAVDISVVWLTEAQLARMHETEGTENYAYTRLDGISLEIAGHGRLDHAQCYWGLRDPFAPGGATVPLAAVTAEGRRDKPFYQADVLSRARDLLAPGVDLDAFILAIVGDAGLRARRTAELGRYGLPTNGRAGRSAQAAAGQPRR